MNPAAVLLNLADSTTNRIQVIANLTDVVMNPTNPCCYTALLNLVNVEMNLAKVPMNRYVTDVFI